MGDADYMYAFQNIVIPVGYHFDPDLVISEYFLFTSRFPIDESQSLPVLMRLPEISLEDAS